MTKNKFLKINLLIFISVVLMNSISYNFLSENISLIFSFRPSGEMRSNVPKTTGIFFIPIISLLVIVTGYFQNIVRRLTHITYINGIIFILNIIIILTNLF